jgi:hypothetical protein
MGSPNLVQPHIDTIALNSVWVKIPEEESLIAGWNIFFSRGRMREEPWFNQGPEPFLGSSGKNYDGVLSELYHSNRRIGRGTHVQKTDRANA